MHQQQDGTNNVNVRPSRSTDGGVYRPSYGPRGPAPKMGLSIQSVTIMVFIILLSWYSGVLQFLMY